MTMQKLLSKTRQAINDFNMINDNDKIAVGLSGGKDSLTLLYALAGLKRFYPNKFEIDASNYNDDYFEESYYQTTKQFDDIDEEKKFDFLNYQNQ